MPGVRIFAGPTAGAAVNGLGYPGQGIHMNGPAAGGETYVCDNGKSTLRWVDITNIATGVRGWVPDRNYVWVD